MKKIAVPAYLLLFAAPLVAGCTLTPRTPMDPNTTVTPLSLTAPPIYALLGFRRELDLSSEQIMMLDSIAESVQRQNAERVADLQKNSRERQRQPGFYDLLPGAVPIFEEIRSSYREAGDAVKELLDREQQSTVCRLFDRERQGRLAARGGAPRVQRSEQIDAILNPAPWTWCDVPAAVASAPPA
jgi:hypothetical protein